MQQLQMIYQQATSLVSGIQKTFEDLNDFHNRMVESKIRFITQDLPKIEKKLTEQRQHLKRLLAEEAELSASIIQSDSFEVLEKLIVELNSKYETKGKYENTLDQLSDVESTLAELNKQLAAIDNDLLIAYVKHDAASQNIVVTIVNLDPYNPQSGWLELDLDDLGMDRELPYQVHDLVSDQRYQWRGTRNFVMLDPQRMPAHVFRVRRHIRSERDFDYFL